MEKVFESVSELIKHYQKFPIKESGNQVLGSGIDKQLEFYCILCALLLVREFSWSRSAGKNDPICQL